VLKGFEFPIFKKKKKTILFYRWFISCILNYRHIVFRVNRNCNEITV